METPAADPGHLLRIANLQRRLLWCFLVAVFLNVDFMLLNLVAPKSSDAPNLVLVVVLLILLAMWIVVWLIIAIHVFELLRATGTHIVLCIFYVLFTVMPCLGLLVLLLAAHKGTHALKTAGYQVGLMGIKKTDLETLREQADSGTAPL
jgi:hypothetical protein